MSDMENPNVVKTGLPMKRKLPEPQPTEPPAKTAAPCRQPSSDSDSSLFSHESNDDVQVVFEKKSEKPIHDIRHLAALPINPAAFASRLNDRDKIVAELIAMYGNIPDEKLETFHNNIKAHIFAFNGMAHLCTPAGPSASRLTTVYRWVWYNSRCAKKMGNNNNAHGSNNNNANSSNDNNAHGSNNNNANGSNNNNTANSSNNINATGCNNDKE
ncbi:hypothetical protein Q1695_000927 [Nippostrongylus brasiliensis]|nr:hypothetical protein Q1695_000927 [Nippostrongylus brasiliensis]